MRTIIICSRFTVACAEGQSERFLANLGAKPGNFTMIGSDRPLECNESEFDYRPSIRVDADPDLLESFFSLL